MVRGVPVQHEDAQALAKQIGKIISRERRRRGMSQQELSRRAGIGSTTIYNIEAGNFNPSLNSLVRIFNVLNLRLSAQRKERADD